MERINVAIFYSNPRLSEPLDRHYAESKRIFDSMGPESVRNIILGYTHALEKLENNPDIGQTETDGIKHSIADAKRYLKEKGLPAE